MPQTSSAIKLQKVSLRAGNSKFPNLNKILQYKVTSGTTSTFQVINLSTIGEKIINLSTLPAIEFLFLYSCIKTCMIIIFLSAKVYSHFMGLSDERNRLV